MASSGAEIIHHQAAAAADRGFKVILGKAPIGWSRAFDDPIALPDGTKLTTLREAVAYLAKTVPKAEQSHPKVLAAAEILTYAAERGIAWVFWRGSRRCGRSTATKRACSIPVGKRRNGQAEAEAGRVARWYGSRINPQRSRKA
jgi:hypothetical protein